MLCTDCNRPIRPVVALDIDGTLGDYHSHFLCFARDWLGKAVDVRGYEGRTDLATHLEIDKETYRKIKLAYRQGGMKRCMPMIDGARTLVIEMQGVGAEVWLTTTRPYLRLDNVDPDTREWLERNQILYDGLIYDEDKYKVLMSIVGKDRIVGILDDEIVQVQRAASLGLKPILAAGYHNKAILQVHPRATLASAERILKSRVKEWNEHQSRK